MNNLHILVEELTIRTLKREARIAQKKDSSEPLEYSLSVFDITSLIHDSPTIRYWQHYFEPNTTLMAVLRQQVQDIVDTYYRRGIIKKTSPNYYYWDSKSEAFQALQAAIDNEPF